MQVQYEKTGKYTTFIVDGVKLNTSIPYERRNSALAKISNIPRDKFFTLNSKFVSWRPSIITVPILGKSNVVDIDNLINSKVEDVECKDTTDRFNPGLWTYTPQCVDGKYGIPRENIDYLMSKSDGFYHRGRESLRFVNTRPKYMSGYRRYSNLDVWAEYGNPDSEFLVKTCRLEVLIFDELRYQVFKNNDSRYSAESLRKALNKGMNITFDSLGVITDPELLKLIPKVKDGDRSTLIAFLIDNPLLPEIAKRQGIPQELYTFYYHFHLTPDQRNRLESIYCFSNELRIEWNKGVVANNVPLNCKNSDIGDVIEDALTGDMSKSDHKNLVCKLIMSKY